MGVEVMAKKRKRKPATQTVSYKEKMTERLSKRVKSRKRKK